MLPIGSRLSGFIPLSICLLAFEDTFPLVLLIFRLDLVRFPPLVISWPISLLRTRVARVFPHLSSSPQFDLLFWPRIRTEVHLLLHYTPLLSPVTQPPPPRQSLLRSLPRRGESSTTTCTLHSAFCTLQLQSDPPPCLAHPQTTRVVRATTGDEVEG